MFELTEARIQNCRQAKVYFGCQLFQLERNSLLVNSLAFSAFSMVIQRGVVAVIVGSNTLRYLFGTLHMRLEIIPFSDRKE